MTQSPGSEFLVQTQMTVTICHWKIKLKNLTKAKTKHVREFHLFGFT